MASWLGLWAQVQCLIQEARFCKPHGMVKKENQGILDDSKNPAREGTNCAHSHGLPWLRIRASTAGDAALTPGQGAILHAM